MTEVCNIDSENRSLAVVWPGVYQTGSGSLKVQETRCG